MRRPAQGTLHPTLVFVVAFILALLRWTATQAQLPPGVFAGQPDYTLAPAGTYALDPDHTAVLARVSHIGYSLSVFRFEAVSGTLTWAPADPARSSLTATVETRSISTPVAGFAAELAGDKYLKSSAFPKATFVSSHVAVIDPTHGRIDGAFTLMGKTVPLTFEVVFMGAGKGFMGHPRIGAEATAQINPTEFGLPSVFGDRIGLVIDAEFARP